MRRLRKVHKLPLIRSAQSLGLNFSPSSVMPSITMVLSLTLTYTRQSFIIYVAIQHTSNTDARETRTIPIAPKSAMGIDLK